MEEAEEVKVYTSFKEMVTSPEYIEMFRSIPVLTYYLYAAGAELLKEGAMTISLNESLRRVLQSIEIPDKPTIEELEQDEEGKLHFRLNDALAPNLVLYLADKNEELMKATQPKKKVLH